MLGIEVGAPVEEELARFLAPFLCSVEQACPVVTGSLDTNIRAPV